MTESQEFPQISMLHVTAHYSTDVLSLAVCTSEQAMGLLLKRESQAVGGGRACVFSRSSSGDLWMTASKSNWI